MGNTYTTPPTVPDTGDLIAGKISKKEAAKKTGPKRVAWSTTASGRKRS